MDTHLFVAFVGFRQIYQMNPVYVSVGHKVSLETATSLVLECSRSRVPEPVRVVRY